MLLLTSMGMAEKKFVPIALDDIVSFASYSVNSLKVPIPAQENAYNKLVIECEDDIAYFIMSYMYYDNATVTADNGNLVIDENVTDATDPNAETVFNYFKGHIDGSGPLSITGSVYYQGELKAATTKTCRSGNTLEVPKFNGNSQGKLVIQCEDDYVYYIMAYDCLRQDTDPSVTTDNGVAVTDKKAHEGEVFYVKGHVKRTGGPVTITGHVYSGGHDLDIPPSWIQTCP
jgi:hypothetical protein